MAHNIYPDIVNDLQSLYLLTKDKSIERLFISASNFAENSFMYWLASQNPAKLNINDPNVLQALLCLERVKKNVSALNYNGISTYFLTNPRELEYFPMIEVFNNIRNQGKGTEILAAYSDILAIGDLMKVSDAMQQPLSKSIPIDNVISDLENINAAYLQSTNIDTLDDDIIGRTKPKKMNRKDKVRILLTALIKKFSEEYVNNRYPAMQQIKDVVVVGNIANSLALARALASVNMLPDANTINLMTMDIQKIFAEVVKTIGQKDESEVFNWIRTKALHWAGAISTQEYQSYIVDNISKQDLGAYIRHADEKKWEEYKTDPKNLYNPKALMFISMCLFKLHDYIA